MYGQTRRNGRTKECDDYSGCSRENVRVFGKAQRNFGQVNLKVDPSCYLDPYKPPTKKQEPLCELQHNLQNLLKTEKGSIIQIVIDYFERCTNVRYFVEQLLLFSLYSDHLVEVTTMNFFLIAQLKYYGEDIKNIMFFLIDIACTDFKAELEDHRLFLKTEHYLRDPQHFIRFSRFVGLLYFRFRRFENSSLRRNRLANANIFVMRKLIEIKTVQSARLLTELTWLNFCDLAKWSDSKKNLKKTELLNSTFGMAMILRDFLTSRERINPKVRTLLLGSFDIMTCRFNITQDVLKYYEDSLGAEWPTYKPHSSIRVLADLHESIDIGKFNVTIEDYSKSKFQVLVCKEY